MMSQVRNSKSLLSLLFKRSGLLSLSVSGLLSLSLLAGGLTGCEQSDPFVNPGETPNPNWELTVENVMLSSMTAIVKVSVTQKEGVLAAFIGDDCCGVTTSENYIDGRYNLYISPSEQGEDVQLKFYDPDMKRIFMAKKTFKYINDERLGSVSDPYTPEWTVAK